MSGKIMAIKESIEKALRDESKPWTRYLTLAEKKSQVDRLYIFFGEMLFLSTTTWCSTAYARNRSLFWGYLVNPIPGLIVHHIIYIPYLAFILRIVISFYSERVSLRNHWWRI